MAKLFIEDLNLAGKRVLMRVDFNVPVKGGVVENDKRIRESLRSIKYVLDQGRQPGPDEPPRPSGRQAGRKTQPQARRRQAVRAARTPGDLPDDCVGPEVESACAESLRPSQVLLLENLRFHIEEEGKIKNRRRPPRGEEGRAKAEMKKKQEEFARQLTKLGDVYVNDAFGTAHRAHAPPPSSAFFKVRGRLPDGEGSEYMGSGAGQPGEAVRGHPRRRQGFRDKVNVITPCCNKVDHLLIGGAMAYTF
jgi:phosphoglycerate kinase